MKKEVRTVVYDDELNIEAFRFEGVVQPFPNHFHENYYVIGIIENGTRLLVCKNTEYTVARGDILIFNPNDNHGCVQCDDGTLDYRELNIPIKTMMALAEDITGSSILPVFSENVLVNEELALYLRSLHQMIMNGGEKVEKEEMLLLFISSLLERYGQPFEKCVLDCREEIELACSFMKEQYAQHISLEQLCECSNLSKSTLLRAFTKSKGITPYRYLQSIRVNKAKTLLEMGNTPIESALQTGFSDQSHFTNFFHMFIGLSPSAYRRIFQKRNEGKADG